MATDLAHSHQYKVKTGGKKSANAKELKNIKLVTYWGCKIQIYLVGGYLFLVVCSQKYAKNVFARRYDEAILFSYKSEGKKYTKSGCWFSVFRIILRTFIWNFRIGISKFHLSYLFISQSSLFLSQRRNPDKSGRKDFFATSRLGEKLKSFRVVIKNLSRNELYHLCGHGL